MPWKRAAATDHIVRRRGNDQADSHDFWELDGDCGANMRMAFVIQNFEVLEAIVENTIRAPLYRESRQRQRRALQLFARLVQMIEIQVAVATAPDEIADIQICLLGEHMSEQRVGRDVERYAEEGIRTALVQLAGELAVSNVKLKHAMTGGQRHVRHISDIPCGNQQSSRIRTLA